MRILPAFLPTLPLGASRVATGEGSCTRAKLGSFQPLMAWVEVQNQGCQSGRE